MKEEINDGKKRMPVLFVGHGDPMNAIMENEYTKKWAELGRMIERPKAILAISAHWYTEGSRITDAVHPKMVYDMYGFPEELYQVLYPAEGAPELAHLTKELIKRDVRIDNSWGYDHGAWSVLYKMYPEADIPLFQMSIDRSAGAEVHYQIGKELSALRDQGVLILGSGNVVHNLAKINWGMEGGLPWAVDFDNYIKESIIKKEYQDVIEYKKAGKSAELAFFTPEHFYPLLYVLGAVREDDQVSIYNDSCTLGSMSMTSYLFKN